jgi:hypothetical protein
MKAHGFLLLLNSQQGIRRQYQRDLLPKPKGMRWATYKRWAAQYDAPEDMLDAQLVLAAAKLMKRP